MNARRQSLLFPHISLQKVGLVLNSSQVAVQSLADEADLSALLRKTTGFSEF